MELVQNARNGARGHHPRSANLATASVREESFDVGRQELRLLLDALGRRREHVGIFVQVLC